MNALQSVRSDAGTSQKISTVDKKRSRSGTVRALDKMVQTDGELIADRVSTGDANPMVFAVGRSATSRLPGHPNRLLSFTPVQ
jgi:hypothetical protein